MEELLRSLVGVLVALAVALFVVFLLLVRPREISVAEARRLVPDIVRLIRDLSRDTSVSGKVRRRVGMLLVYLALPIDLVPDFIPVLGYADDVILIALVLRSIVRHPGVEILERHWRGTPEGLLVLRGLAGMAHPNL
jgi:uncharacterized membrane protein YkvA (DUF1232 family)